MKRIRFGLAGFALALLVNAPITADDSVIKAADLKMDVGVLRKAYEELHPGLYRYNSKAEMDERFDALQRELSRDVSLQRAYLAFSVFAAQVKCGHTYPNFFNQDKAVAASLFQGQNRVPFYFRWLDGRMIVTRDFTPNGGLARGTEVLAINGIPVKAILEKLITIARADGSNDPKRISYLEVRGESVYEAFDIYFPMFFPQKSTTLEATLLRPREKEAATLRMRALTYEQRIAPIQAREAGRKGGNEVLFDWKRLSGGAAYLRMPTWAVYQSKWDWKGWLNSRLDELAESKATALVIDLRGNEGGNDVGNEILQRLVPRDLKLATSPRLVRYRETPAELNPFLATWDPSFKNWGAAAVEMAQPWPTAPPIHYFALTKFDDAGGSDVIHPLGKPFQGKVFVLIDASNSSATFQFAEIVQRNKLGTLVGQPTGGNLRGINGGAFFFLRLPKSGIEMDVPLIGRFPATPQIDGGITPDVTVSPTVADIVDGKDVELAMVEMLLRK